MQAAVLRAQGPDVEARSTTATRFLIPGKQRRALWRQPVARRSQAPGEGQIAGTLYINTVKRRMQPDADMAVASPGCGSAPYCRRHPSRSVLYQVVQQHLETYLTLVGEHDWDGQRVPAYLEREFRRYLECGILAYGFARARCPDCGHDFLVAFSCKGRGLCPSCNARRMAETAAHLRIRVSSRIVASWFGQSVRRSRDSVRLETESPRRLLSRIAVNKLCREPSRGADPADQAPPPSLPRRARSQRGPADSGHRVWA
jgi:hypothetical protein